MARTNPPVSLAVNRERSVGRLEHGVQRDAEPVFEAGDGGEVRPGVPVEDAGDSGVVDPGELADDPQAASVDGVVKIAGEPSCDFGDGVVAGRIGPVVGVGVRRGADGTCHDNSLDGTAATPRVGVSGRSGLYVTPPSYDVVRYQHSSTGSAVSEAIDNYRPRNRKHDWHLDQGFVTAAVHDSRPRVA